MSEPNVFLVEGEMVLIAGVVTDTHWRDKGIYQIRVKTQEGERELWFHERSLQEVPEA